MPPQAPFTWPKVPDALALADAVIWRSGAGTIAELTALGKATLGPLLVGPPGGGRRRSASTGPSGRRRAAR
jgi:UDP-N-acetylglucosamine--N-acetylmuramyl-(pentapeptide) pyrophosphoryl-undecaprenol N-acetylglucosamine transferase